MNETPPFECLGMRGFKTHFGAQGATLMSAHALRKELRLLRNACPYPPKDTMPDHLIYAEDRVRISIWLKDILPSEPGTVETVQHVLAPLPASEKWFLRTALHSAEGWLQACPHPTTTFLVPVRWPERMAQLLGGIMFPTCVGIWGWDIATRPRPRWRSKLPLTSIPPSIRAAALLDAAARAVSSSSKTSDTKKSE